MMSCRLQDVVNTALFKIVSNGNQEIVIDLTNFFLGGKNVNNLDKVDAVAILNGDDAGLQFVKNGSHIPSRDIEVQYDKEGSVDVHILQVCTKLLCVQFKITSKTSILDYARFLIFSFVIIYNYFI